MGAIGRALSETSQASVKIRRNDAEQTLTVNLNDIRQLAESRQ
jgi:hypothetical protein